MAILVKVANFGIRFVFIYAARTPTSLEMTPFSLTKSYTKRSLFSYSNRHYYPM